jgi:carbon storage regulator
MMLVLTRKAGERILIGDDIVITVVRTGRDAIRIGVDAPRAVSVIREELQKNSPQPQAAATP